MSTEHPNGTESLTDYVVTACRRTPYTGAQPRINGPEDFYELLRPQLTDPHREHFFGAYLSTKNHVLALELVSLGSLSASIVHPREVYKPAFIHSAAALLIAHNHPSGDPTPSAEDIALTRRLATVGELLGIRLLDHLILGDNTYLSLKEQGHF